MKKIIFHSVPFAFILIAGLFADIKYAGWMTHRELILSENKELSLSCLRGVDSLAPVATRIKGNSTYFTLPCGTFTAFVISAPNLDDVSLKWSLQTLLGPFVISSESGTVAHSSSTPEKSVIYPKNQLSYLSFLLTSVFVWLIALSLLTLLGFIIKKSHYRRSLLAPFSSKVFQIFATSALFILLINYILLLPDMEHQFIYQKGPHSEPVGDVFAGNVAKQEFICPEDQLSGVSVLLATWGRPETGPMTVTLSRKQGDAMSLVAQQTFKVRDNGFHDFSFKPQEDSAGKTYVLEFSCPQILENTKSNTVWLCQGSPEGWSCWMGDEARPDKTVVMRLLKKCEQRFKTILLVLLCVLDFLIMVLLLKPSWLRWGRFLSERSLILFTPRVLVVSLFVIFSCVLLTSYRINFSSIELFNASLFTELTNADEAPILFGRPKMIRSDEWLVSSPNFLGQTQDFFRKPQPLMGWAMRVIDPLTWSSIILPIEYYFSFMDTAKICFGSLFLFYFLLIITRNNFTVALWATLFLQLSGHQRWWGNGTEVFNFYGALVFGFYFFLSKHRMATLIAFIPFLLFLKSFALALYPPWQVTCGYLGVALFIGACLTQHRWKGLLAHWKLKLILSSLAVLAGLVFIGLWYDANRENMHVMLNTVYPGRRFSLGGDWAWKALFAGFYDFFLREHRFLYSNVCESSNYLHFFPFLLPAILLFAGRCCTPLILALTTFLGFLFFYCTVGFTPFWAEITGFRFVPTFRLLLSFGWAGILLVACFLSYRRGMVLTWSRLSGLLFLLAVLVCGTFAYFMKSQDFAANFTTPQRLFLLFAYLSCGIALLLGLFNLYYRWIFFSFSLALVIIPSWGTNPIAVGLSPIYRHALVKRVQSLYQENPQAKWCVFGGWNHCQAVRSTGATVMFGGNIFPPDLKAMQKLDPEKKHSDTYNRYANVNVFPCKKHEQVIFNYHFTDHYTLGLYPGHPALKELGIRFLVLPANASVEDQNQWIEDGLVPLDSEDDSYNGYRVYELK